MLFHNPVSFASSDRDAEYTVSWGAAVRRAARIIFSVGLKACEASTLLRIVRFFIVFVLYELFFRYIGKALSVSFPVSVFHELLPVVIVVV